MECGLIRLTSSMSNWFLGNSAPLAENGVGFVGQLRAVPATAGFLLGDLRHID
jgi:hypothetical protein